MSSGQYICIRQMLLSSVTYLKHLRFTFVFMLFLELRSVALGFLALVLPTKLQEIFSVILFLPTCSNIEGKK